MPRPKPVFPLERIGPPPERAHGIGPIEKAIPIVALTRGIPARLREMEVGDSFFIPHANTAGTNLHQAFARVGRPLGWRFSTRRVEGGLRVWRVE